MTNWIILILWNGLCDFVHVVKIFFTCLQVTSPARQMSSRVPVAAASPATLCVMVRTTVATARMRWSVHRPPAVPVSSSVETPHASQPAGYVMMMLTAR